MKRYRFVHFFLHNSQLFNCQIQHFIRNNFSAEDHCFIYRYEENIPKELIQDDNTKHDETIGNPSKLSVYASNADYIILHNLTYNYEDLISVDSECLHKLIWIVWGGDLYRISDKQSKIYLGLRNIYHFINGYTRKKELANHKIRQFAGISALFSGDRYYVSSKIGYNGKILDAGYPLGYYNKDIDCWVKSKNDSKKTIMIGHSGFEYLNHIKYLEMLKKYKNEIKLLIPLNYGNEQYIEKIKKYLNKYYYDANVDVVLNKLPPDEYCSLLNGVDIAIIDCLQQSALGNIFVLLYLEKKVFLNKNGVLYTGFIKDGVKVYRTDSIRGMSMKELLNKDDYTFNKQYASRILDEKETVKRWKVFFDNFK